MPGLVPGISLRKALCLPIRGGRDKPGHDAVGLLWRQRHTDLAGDAAANAVLQKAAQNGGGNFYTANNQAELELALQKAITSILQAVFTFATPVVPTTSTTGSTKAYLAAFKSDQVSPFWQGFLNAYNRDSHGLVKIDAQGHPLQRQHRAGWLQRHVS